MSQHTGLPAGLGPFFSVADARAAGVSSSRLRAHDLARPFHGVRANAGASVGDTDDPGAQTQEEREALLRVRQYATRMPAGGFFTHTSAAVVWGLPLPALFDGRVHVGVLHPFRAPRGRGVVGHELVPHLVDIRRHDGLRVSSPASTWAHLGSLLTTRDLVAVGDAIVRIPRARDGRPGPQSGRLASIDELRSALNAGRRSGSRRLRAALELITAGSSSRTETWLRLDLRAAGLPAPELDVEVFDRHGGFIGVSEFAYPQWMVLVEYEGDHHRTSRKQWNRDIDKYARARAAGWNVVQITAEHLFSPSGGAVERVRAALVAAGWRPSG